MSSRAEPMAIPPQHTKHLLCMLILWIIVIANSQATQAQQVVIYPSGESNQDQRAIYPLALLKLCEEKSGHQFTLQQSHVQTQQGRSLMQLEHNQGINIVWALTSPEREQKLLPVRIPIDRGLIGWRLLLIHSDNREKFAGITRLDELAQWRAGQGHDWPDVDVLRANGMRIATSTTYEGLFDMLAIKHIDYFPRAISEVWPELEAHTHLPLTIDTHLILHYPTAFYFFVNKSNVTLAATLEACLNEAIADGSFLKLFNDYFHNALLRTDVQHRRIIELKNPNLPAETPLLSSQYWYDPTDTLK